MNKVRGQKVKVADMAVRRKTRKSVASRIGNETSSTGYALGYFAMIVLTLSSNGVFLTSSFFPNFFELFETNFLKILLL